MLVEREYSCRICLGLKCLVLRLLRMEDQRPSNIFTAAYASEMIVILVRLWWELTSMLRSCNFTNLLSWWSNRSSVVVKSGIYWWTHFCHWTYISLTIFLSTHMRCICLLRSFICLWNGFYASTPIHWLFNFLFYFFFNLLFYIINFLFVLLVRWKAPMVRVHCLGNDDLSLVVLFTWRTAALLYGWVTPFGAWVIFNRACHENMRTQTIWVLFLTLVLWII